MHCKYDEYNKITLILNILFVSVLKYMDYVFINLLAYLSVLIRTF